MEDALAEPLLMVGMIMGLAGLLLKVRCGSAGRALECIDRPSPCLRHASVLDPQIPHRRQPSPRGVQVKLVSWMSAFVTISGLAHAKPDNDMKQMITSLVCVCVCGGGGGGGGGGWPPSSPPPRQRARARAEARLTRRCRCIVPAGWRS